MQFCTNCNIEYEEDKKYCKFCGDPLVPKNDSLSTPKKVNAIGEEGTKVKLYCPHCKLNYEFGSSCIQCGSPLVRQSFTSTAENPKPDHSPLNEEKFLKKETLHSQKETSSHKFICPVCKRTYENGNFCISCGSALVDQISEQLKKETNGASDHGEEKSPQLQTLQEQLIQIPNKNLICPQCRIIYERGDSCVRCGASLLSQSPSTKENSEPSEPLENRPLILQLEGEALSEVSSGTLPFTEEQGSVHIDQIKKEGTEIKQASEIEKKKEPPQVKITDQKSLKTPLEKFERVLTPSKKDYRRLFLEVGSIATMVFAGGYFIWSIFTHITKKSEPLPTLSKEESAISQINSSSIQPILPKTEIGEAQNSVIGEDSSIARDQTQVSSTSLIEAQEIENIKALLENIRKANLQKDDDLFISCYATDFKNREGKKKATLNDWKNFDYLDLSYELKALSISGDTAKANIEWVIKISPIGKNKPQQLKTLLNVILSKENGSWKIKEVQQVG